MVLIVTHCGAGSNPDVADAAERAGREGLGVLEGGGSALDAVEAAVALLEDDPRLNAGTGGRLNLEGVAEMDAALMASDQRCGAVAAITRVRNPIRVARRVLESPHVLLVGPGATAFARRQGFPDYDPVTPRARELLQEALRQLRDGELPPWQAHHWKDYHFDTVGAVAEDAQETYAAAGSTGGVSLKLPGRVGDTPLVGCGLYAGPGGAVTATGVGEEIIRRVLSKEVYDRIVAGEDPHAACAAALRPFPTDVTVGLVAVGRRGWAAASNRDMAWWCNAGRPGRERGAGASRPP